MPAIPLVPSSVEPQAVLSGLTESAIFLVTTVSPGGEETASELLADVAGLRRSVGFRVPEAGLSCVVGVGAGLWDRIYGERPKHLHALAPVAGATHSAPSTPGDLLFHIRSHRFDLCFELARLILERLDGAGEVVDEVHGFRSFDERDLLGFVDGTENPEGREAAEAVFVGDEDTAFAGGSYVVVQKYVHDVRSWDGLSVEQQELAVGRTKLSDIELPDERKPSNSHLTLNTIVEDDGTERQIMRFNMPFGRAATDAMGTYFIGYARDPGVIELMLQRMFVGEPAGNHDRLLDFSRALTGGLFFVPSAGFLENGPAAPSQDGAAAETADSPGDGSLGIGGLAGKP